jgi:hypothetical protein
LAKDARWHRRKVRANDSPLILFPHFRREVMNLMIRMMASHDGRPDTHVLFREKSNKMFRILVVQFSQYFIVVRFSAVLYHHSRFRHFQF